MDGSHDLDRAEEDLRSTLNFPDLCASNPIAGMEGLLQGLAQMKQLDFMAFPAVDVGDVPTKLDESLLQLPNSCSLGVINATIENPYIMPDVEASWIRPKDETVKQISHRRLINTLIGSRPGATGSPFAASLNGKVSFSARVFTLMKQFSNVRKCYIAHANQGILAIMSGAEDISSKMIEIGPTAESQNNSLEITIFFEKLFGGTSLRLMHGLTLPKDIRASGRGLLSQPVVQLWLCKDMTAWKPNDCVHIEIWKEPGLQEYHILLWDKMTKKLIVQVRLGGQWQITYTASGKGSQWINFNDALDTPEGRLERVKCPGLPNSLTARELVDVVETCVGKGRW